MAMSGGVDSSVAAFLLKEGGNECTGCYMILNEYITEDGATDAEAIADKLGITFTTTKFEKEFEEKVLEYFTSDYLSGKTPNPCVECNKHIKFGALLDYTVNSGFDKLATGHYARIEKEGNRFYLKKAADLSKDQSYFLYGLSQEQLSKVVFPLGDYVKEDIRKIAEEQGFVNAHKKDSQDICFVPEGKYAQVIEKKCADLPPEGKFVAKDGRVLGTHKGIHRYTFGQRKGLGISADRPLYVIDINTKTNEVVLGDNEDLFVTKVKVKNVNWIKDKSGDKSFRAKARLRYCHKEQPATIEIIGEDTIMIVFDEPQRAATKGQSAVVYDGDYVICGGIIESD